MTLGPATTAGIYLVNRQLNVSHTTCANANLGCTMGLVMRGESSHGR